MECWAHAAALRRQSRAETSTIDSSSSSSSKSNSSNTSSNISSNTSSNNSSRKSSSATSTGPNLSLELEFRVFNNMIRKALPHGSMPHVCIVGAGMSGLKAAEVLARKGVQVTIFEGRGRIGGRIHQSTHLGPLTDLGPNWIHGTQGNPILDLARETGTPYFEPPTDVPTWLYDENGKFVDSQKSQEQTCRVWETIEEAYKYSRDNTGSIPPERSLLDFFKMRFKEQNIDEPTTKQMLQIAGVWGDVVGEPVDGQSLKFFWLEECLEGGPENAFLGGTYKAILDHVSKSALPGVNLQLQTVVRSIAAITKPDGSASVTLTTDAGETAIFDEVILTTPLGWLKRNLTAFSPPLPARITTAIQHISYGRLEKVYVTFPRAWWLTPNTPRPFFTQFLSPAYSTATNPERWSIECTSLASLPEPSAHPTLLFYINGPCAHHVTSLVRDCAPGSPAHLAKLVAFFRPYFSRLPHYSADDDDDDDCVPRAVLATDWIHDDLAGNGSYSNFQTSRAEEGVELDRDIEALREGWPEMGLWFAGEATAPFVALGTVTGAFWSGEAVGRRVAGVYGLEDEEEEEDEDDEGNEKLAGEVKGMNGSL